MSAAAKLPDPLRCQAKRKKGEQPCDGFVFRPGVGSAAHVVGIVRHSDRAAPSNVVAPCVRCGALHEIESEVLRHVTLASISHIRLRLTPRST